MIALLYGLPWYVYWFPPIKIISLIRCLLTDNSFVSPRVVNVVVSRRDWVLEVLCDSVHAPLTLVDQVLLLVDRAIVLATAVHGLVLHVGHGIHGSCLLVLKHLLELLLLGDG